MNALKTVMGASILALALLAPVGAAVADAVDFAQISSARTHADHEAIAKAYEDEAADLSSKAAMHTKMSASYRATGAMTKGPYSGLATHCEALAKELNAAAKQSRELAAAHHKLAMAAEK